MTSTSICSSIGSSIYQALPKNRHAKVVALLDQKIATLQERLRSGMADPVFHHSVELEYRNLKKEMADLQGRVDELNGKYFKSPEGYLHATKRGYRKEAHDSEHREPLNQLFHQLVSERDQKQKRLKHVVSILASHEHPTESHQGLRLQKVEAQQELQQLQGLTGKENSEKRKTLRAKIERIDHLLRKNPGESMVIYRVRTRFQQQQQQLIQQRDHEQSLVRVDKVAVGVMSLGYGLMASLVGLMFVGDAVFPRPAQDYYYT